MRYLVISLDMTNTKPLVQVACLAEKVLMERESERSGAVPSLIRLIDTLGLHMPPEMPPGAKGMISVTAFVALKSGPVTGTHKLGMTLNYPDGKRVPTPDVEVTLRGGVHGHFQTFIVNMEVGALGPHYFDVLWDDESITQIPFNLVNAPDQTPPSPQSPTAKAG